VGILAIPASAKPGSGLRQALRDCANPLARLPAACPSNLHWGPCEALVTSLPTSLAKPGWLALAEPYSSKAFSFLFLPLNGYRMSRKEFAACAIQSGLFLKNVRETKTAPRNMSDGFVLRPLSTWNSSSRRQRSSCSGESCTGSNNPSPTDCRNWSSIFFKYMACKSHICTILAFLDILST